MASVPKDNTVLELETRPGNDPGRVVIPLTAPPSGAQFWKLRRGDGFLLEMNLRIIRLMRVLEDGKTKVLRAAPGVDAQRPPDRIEPDPVASGAIDAPKLRIDMAFSDGRDRTLRRSRFEWRDMRAAEPSGLNVTPASDLRNWTRAGVAMAVRIKPEDPEPGSFVSSLQWQYTGGKNWPFRRDYGSREALGPTQITVTADADDTMVVTWRLSEIRLWWLHDETFSQTPKMGFEETRLDGKEPGLAGYWRVDEGQGNRIFDATGAGNTGRIEGKTRWISESELEWDGALAGPSRMTSLIRDARAQQAAMQEYVDGRAVTVMETDRRRRDIEDYVPILNASATIERELEAARLEAVQAEFNSWKKAEVPENTTLQNFLSEVGGKLDESARSIDAQNRPLRLRSASIDAGWTAAKTELVEGGIKGVRAGVSAEAAEVITDTPHGLQTSDRVTLTMAEDVNAPAATPRRRDVRIRVLASDRFAVFTPAGRPLSHDVLAEMARGTWRHQDRFRIRFPQIEDTVGNDAERLSRFRFDFRPTPPPEPERKKPEVPDVTGYTEDFAIRHLRAAGFRVETYDFASDDPARLGQVLSQQPSAKTPTDPETAVRIFVAKAGANANENGYS